MVQWSLERSMYQLEATLVEDLQSGVSKTSAPFKTSAIALEFNYNHGKVDMIAKNSEGYLIAFEAKLKRWRDALTQAYRSSSFAHFSYVVLPESRLSSAMKAADEFKRRGVGLCTISSSGIKIAIPATKKLPLQPWLTDAALQYIAES